MQRVYNANSGSFSTTDSANTTDVQTVTLPATAISAALSAETADARITVDGTTPSATAGHKIVKDQMPFILPIAPVNRAIKFVSTTGSTSTLKVTPLFP